MISVREFMSGPPVVVDSETSLADACKLMGERHIGSILLSHGGVIHAIFTERDLMSRVLIQVCHLLIWRKQLCSLRPTCIPGWRT